MLNNKLLITCTVLVLLLVLYILSGNYTQVYYYNQDIQYREYLSRTTPEKKFTIEKTFILNQSHGSSTRVYVGKFECCGVTGMVKDGEIYLGYLNTTEATPLGTTTKQQIPEIDTEMMVHELTHLVTLQPYVLERCPAFATSELQEKVAYNLGHLYSQLRSIHEDNFIRLVK